MLKSNNAEQPAMYGIGGMLINYYNYTGQPFIDLIRREEKRRELCVFLNSFSGPTDYLFLKISAPPIHSCGGLPFPFPFPLTTTPK